MLLGFFLVLGAASLARAASSERGHARPAALAVDAGGNVVYIALSTADRLAAIDVSAGHPPSVLWQRPICAHPTALAAVPAESAARGGATGGVLVSCRFDPDLRLVTPSPAAQAPGTRPADPAVEVRIIPAGPEHGQRGLAVDPWGRHAYVASAALGGVKVVDLRGPSTGPVGFRATGLDPGVVRLVPELPGSGKEVGSPPPSTPLLLLVANRISHTVTVHRIGPDGAVLEATQTIWTEAPVLDLAVTDRALYLLTYEDRPITRARRDVEGLDSVVLVLARAAEGGDRPFSDPGSGRRKTLNLSEWPGAPVVAPEAAALWTDGATGTTRLAVAGSGTDNLWISGDLRSGRGGGCGAALDLDIDAAFNAAMVVPVGTNPSAVAFLPDGRIVTADRLSDSVSVVAPRSATTAPTAAPVSTLSVGNPTRTRPAELGEVLFFSRALVPNNTAAGPLSLYTCAACHLEGHVDGRRHPSKFDRFTSMTKTCRGLAGTEPFLSLGRPATLAAFADNIVSTHAQGGPASPVSPAPGAPGANAEFAHGAGKASIPFAQGAAAKAPVPFDRYDVTLRLPLAVGDAPGGQALNLDWRQVRVTASGLRTALAAYLADIPAEPSPFVAPGRTTLTPPERRGLHTFRAAGCAGCHRLVHSTAARAELAPEAVLERELLRGRVALTAAGLFDVGTPVLGAGGNNPPSLRGVWAAAPYFSDGSAQSLEEVLGRTDPHAELVHAPAQARAASLAPPFTALERADLVAFLRAL